MANQIFGQDTQTGGEGHNYMVVRDNGSLDVNIQDQITPPVDFYFHQMIGTPTALTDAVAIDDYTLTVDDPTNFSVGDYLELNNGFTEFIGSRFFFAEVLIVAGSVLTIDTPIDFAFPAGSNVISSTRSLNVLASLASPVIFSVHGAFAGSGINIDITRININMISAGQPDDAKFGDLAELTNGIVFRRVDGDTRNMWNAKSNGDLGIISGIDLTYSARSVPQGSYGIKARMSYAGTEKHGVALRLEPGDSLQMIMQDDLSSLVSFRIMAQGHIVD